MVGSAIYGHIQLVMDSGPTDRGQLVMDAGLTEVSCLWTWGSAVYGPYLV